MIDHTNDDDCFDDPKQYLNITVTDHKWKETTLIWEKAERQKLIINGIPRSVDRCHEVLFSDLEPLSTMANGSVLTWNIARTVGGQNSRISNKLNLVGLSIRGRHEAVNGSPTSFAGGYHGALCIMYCNLNCAGSIPSIFEFYFDGTASRPISLRREVFANKYRMLWRQDVFAGATTMQSATYMGMTNSEVDLSGLQTFMSSATNMASANYGALYAIYMSTAANLNPPQWVGTIRLYYTNASLDD